jgi:protein phosphatase 2C family protein 2/3
MYAAEFRGPGVHHRIDDDPDDIDMDLDQRFRPNAGGRIILLGDGTEISTDAPDSQFDQENEDKDLDSQVDKYNKEESKREGTPGPQSSSAQVTESPSSVQTEHSDSPSQTLKDVQGDKKPLVDTEASSK